MGQKVNPKSFRLGTVYTWDSHWFSEKSFSQLLKKDILIRDYLKKKIKDKGLAKIEIKRSGNEIELNIYSSRPGMIIGRGGAGIEELKKDIIKNFFKEYFTSKNKPVINLNIKEIKNPNMSAELIAQAVVADIEKRMPFRRAIKQALERIRKARAKGAKILVAGRLNGVEIARSEHVSFGSLPLHTLRAEIDYALVPAFTIYGAIGVRVWIYKGEVFNKKNKEQKK